MHYSVAEDEKISGSCRGCGEILLKALADDELA